MVFSNNLLLGAAGQSGAFNTTLIGRSAWLDGAADYMARQNGSAFTNTKEAIFSFWIKRCKFSTQQAFFGSVESSGGFILQFNSADKLWVYVDDVTRKISTQVFRDTAYYHIIVSFDTSQATATDRIKVWVNGEQITSWTTDTAMTLNGDIGGLVGAQTGAETMHIGNYNNTVSNYYFWNGYVAQACMLESVSIQQGDYAVSDFLDTYTFGDNGSQYVPRADATIAALATAAGGNSFCLTTAIGDGTDASGNGNNFTPTSMSDTANGSADTPSLDYCILSPLSIAAYTGTFSEGNLRLVVGSNDMQFGTMFPQTGKWFFEVYVTDANNSYIGIVPETNANGEANASYGWRNGALLNTNGDIYTPSGTTNDGSPSWGDGVRVGVAYDVDNHLVWWSIDGQWYSADDSSDAPIAITEVEAGNQGYDFSGLGGTGFAPCIAASDTGGDCTLNTGTPTASFIDSTSNSDGNGYGLFADPVPSGFLALNSANLPTPDYQGIDYFNPILYTGNGSTNAITGVGFQPDLVWIKNRTGTTSHSLYDAVRGVQEQIESDNTSAETTETTGLTAFGSDGFTVGSLAQVNTNTNNFVGWSWLAGGAGASNTDGSITSTVSKAAADHFSIVTYTGTGATSTVGHGLGVAPKFLVVKRRDASSDYWPSWHADLTSSYIPLDQTLAQQSDSSIFNNTDPTSTVFTVGSGANSTNTNASGSDYIAYCFAEVENLSKISSYKGNGSANGPFVYCGFRPAWIMIRRYTSSGAWTIFDNQREGYNVDNDELVANTTAAETTTDYVDILSNGFKLRSTDADVNASGGGYIFMAFADIAGNGDLPPIYGR